MTSRVEFECKLAHSSEVKKLSNFNSIKDLYQRVSNVFSVPIDQILYCTLNTHNFRDVNSMLGNYLSYGDLIVVHLCGKSREVTVRKSQEFLGLTITDNANGRAYVKRVKSEDSEIEDKIKPGDHIAAINTDSTVGLRHFEVAKAIRMLPMNINFTMRLVEPKHLDLYDINATNVNNRTDISIGSSLYADHERLKTQTSPRATPHRHDLLSDASSINSTCEDLINSSLPIDRLLSKCGDGHKQPGGVQRQDGCTEPEVDRYKQTIEKINSILDSFMGINDNLLAIQIYRLARESADSYTEFLGAMKQSELSAFNFDDEMKNYLWKCAWNIPVQ